MNIAVLCSGNGSNLQAIIDKVRDGYIPAGLAVVVSDNKDAFALKRAKKAGIETFVLNPRNYGTRKAFDKEVIKILQKILKSKKCVVEGHFNIGKYNLENFFMENPGKTRLNINDMTIMFIMYTSIIEKK